MSAAPAANGPDPAPGAPPRSLLARLRALHADRRAQILPLVFFLGIAFFTGVVLVIDTGRVVKDREETQSAVDAASVSGVTTLARGMNYVASNNITMAKILATVVILRAFENAIEVAETTLDVWEAVGTTLQGMGWVPYVGGALVALGNAIIWKVKIERPILKALKSASDSAKQAWDNDGNGPAWVALRALTTLGDVLVHSTPALAQWTARRVYEANLPDATGAQAWMLPLYPSLPACKGKFGDLFEPTKKYTERYAEPIITAGWVLLTLSLFPLWYEESLDIELKRLFTGAGGSVSGNDPDQARLTQLKDEQKTLALELEKLEAKKQVLEAELADLQARKEGGEPALDDDIEAKLGEVVEVQSKIDEIKEKMEDNNDEMEAINDRRTQAGGGRPGGEASDGKLGDLGGAAATDRDYPRPWMIEGAGWPGTFSYPCLAWRDAPDGLLPTRFKKPMDRIYVFAAARLFNPTRADLWTPDWRARLVKTDLTGITNPFGAVKGGCGEGGGGGTGDLPGLSPPDADEQKGILERLAELSKH